MTRYALFLPQFHRVEVNDRAWGSGFTDWALVAAANAFDYWNRRSPECGFYDLANPAHVQAQFDTAARTGLDGFAIYHYWFTDGPELDVVERYLRKSSPPEGFEYFFVWASENWSRRWAGRNTQILKTVSTSPSRDEVAEHVSYLRPYMESLWYTRTANRPIFVIYRPDIFKDPGSTVALYREEFERVKLCPLIGYFLKNVSDIEYSRLFDFCYVFEPRVFFNSSGIRKRRFVTDFFKNTLRRMSPATAEMVSEHTVRLLNRGRRKYSFAEFLAYFNSVEREALLKALSCPVQDVLTFGWNNAPRYRHRSVELEVPNREQCETMLRVALREHACSEAVPLLCNAWNEWSEGAAIEPCSYLGDSLLKSYLMEE